MVSQYQSGLQKLYYFFLKQVVFLHEVNFLLALLTESTPYLFLAPYGNATKPGGGGRLANEAGELPV